MEGNRNSIRRKKTQLHSTVFGIILTAGVNLAFYIVCLYEGLTYLTPPPPEKSMVLDFVTMEEPQPEPEEPAAATEDLDGTPVKQSEAPVEGQSLAKTQEASVGDKGDVEVPEPKREEVIDKKSLFRAPKHPKKDTVADYTAKKDLALKDGNAQGKSIDGAMDGVATVNVGMRGARGKLPVPVYVGQESGTVVVEVTVDREGNVCSATAGAKGTTTTLKKLWNAAEKAAMDTKFNVDPSAPGLQTGTITYKFLLTDGN